MPIIIKTIINMRRIDKNQKEKQKTHTDTDTDAYVQLKSHTNKKERLNTNATINTTKNNRKPTQLKLV